MTINGWFWPFAADQDRQRVGWNSVAYSAECFVISMRCNMAITYCTLRIASYALHFRQSYWTCKLLILRSSYSA